VAEGGKEHVPPILTLLDTIEEHRGAFEYDWRNRFHVGLDSVPEVMGWGEAWRLFERLATDPSSQVGAALAGWNFPLSREGLALSDLFDVNARAHFKKPKPYIRPWDEKPRKFGNRSLTKAQFIALRAQAQQNNN
jgi:hypothetical protein